MTKTEETKSVPITKPMVWQAWKKVKSNKGSAGVDEQTLTQFEENLSKNLYKVWNRLSSGSYFPSAVKRVAIPKKAGGQRKLGIPTITDRIAQMVAKDYLEARFESLFHPHSYGYRPMKSAHQAVEQVKDNCRKYGWVIDMDIKGFFDNIDHDLLIKVLSTQVEEKWVMMYIKRWLKVPVQEVNGEMTVHEGKGTPQGGPISPLLANVFLHYTLDNWLEVNYPQVMFVRYADDVIIHCSSKEEADRLLKTIAIRMQQCKLQLHPKKTQVVYCKSYKRKEHHPNVKFDFLGFSFQPRSLRGKQTGRMFLGFGPQVSTESRKRMVGEVSRMRIHRWSTGTIEELAALLNPKIRGWMNYYGKIHRRGLDRVFRALHWRLMKWASNRYKAFKGSINRSYELIRRMFCERRDLFSHWRAGYQLV
ncbi:MAG: group II intron reverse transcriptase/maturase [Bacteroidetes bacterium]|nr:MAG: group II intron reverse transcriptase/maturase [Bacteroidota bacterium]